MEEALFKKEEAPESRLVKLLLEKDLQITCAESCTGGMIASRLVNVPGNFCGTCGGLCDLFQ